VHRLLLKMNIESKIKARRSRILWMFN